MYPIVYDIHSVIQTTERNTLAVQVDNIFLSYRKRRTCKPA